ncbi:hypothetical protein PENTCL1PPCAC_13274, partial [Pristionchus entomophagus]
HQMDLLSLPDVFLRKLMRTMMIKDRLRLRLVCRAFKELVANTHASYFEQGSVYQNPAKRGFNIRPFQKTIEIRIGDGKCNYIRMARVEEQEHFLHLRKRLFSGITLGKFEIDLYDNLTPDLDFYRRLTEKFKIREIHFDVDSTTQLEKSLQFVADYPCTEFTMQMRYTPTYPMLLSLPAMKEFTICQLNQEMVVFCESNYHNAY